MHKPNNRAVWRAVLALVQRGSHSYVKHFAYLLCTAELDGNVFNKPLYLPFATSSVALAIGRIFALGVGHKPFILWGGGQQSATRRA